MYLSHDVATLRVVIAPTAIDWSLMTQLPVHELASLSLFRATPAQVFEVRKWAGSHWGPPLAEEHDSEHKSACNDKMGVTVEHAMHSKWATWVLAPRNSPDTLDIASACQTYKRNGIVRYSGTKETHEVTCYGVAYVYTLPHKRGKGYASHMMRLLHWVTSKRTSESTLLHFPQEWGAPPPEAGESGDASFSVLYSAVGDKFYRETGLGVEKIGGWEARPWFSSTWQIQEQDETEQDCGIAGDKWRLLKREDLDDSFWARDVQLIRRTVENLPASHPDYYIKRPTVFVTSLPDKDIFHTVRSIIFSLEDVISMNVWGIEKEGNPDQPTYATWIVDTKPCLPVLLITRLSATEEDFPWLIKRIREIARKSKIWKIEALNIPSYLLGGVANTGGKTLAGEKRLPGIKWYGEGETADVEWVFNEKYAYGYSRKPHLTRFLDFSPADAGKL